MPTFVAQQRPGRLCLTGIVTPASAQRLVAAHPGAFIVEAPDMPEALHLAKQRIANTREGDPMNHPLPARKVYTVTSKGDWCSHCRHRLTIGDRVVYIDHGLGNGPEAVHAGNCEAGADAAIAGSDVWREDATETTTGALALADAPTAAYGVTADGASRAITVTRTADGATLTLVDESTHETADYWSVTDTTTDTRHAEGPLAAVADWFADWLTQER